jgi:glycerol-3-phosphate acyltransferase PlsY
LNFIFVAAIILSAVVSYLLGSCNSSIIVVRLLKKEDIRNHGSKNAGLTNTLRCFGKVPALLTMIGDLLKGVIAVLISMLIMKLFGFHYGPNENNMFIGYIAGFLAILGHIFPIYYGFKGGKGILVSSSILIVIDPLTFCIIIPFFALMVAITKYVSVSSITAAVAYPILTFLTQYYIQKFPINYVILHTVLTACTGVLLIYMHRTNIQRLKNGTENKFSFKKKEER